MNKTAIIDYDAGNIRSVEKACNFLGEDVIVTRDLSAIENAERLILPGVGNFGDAMQKLEHFGLIEVIRRAYEKGKPLFGICLGLQLLFEESEESPGVPGLGLLPGKICRIPEAPGLTVPQIGWNDLSIRSGKKLFSGIPDHSYVYFVHSYYLRCSEDAFVAATTDYGVLIHAAVERENLFACQFHPEKSSKTGLSILKNFFNVR